ncbi:hypothetical protein [Okeania sp. SIO2B3]|uniref:hypothetical protein n=1 Tax=Okeania sp. SIO2B3 TaxID=2607784 RepID=UPI0013C1352A|nr:hypothetical protein [Okeania sp. SIO2B3]NET41098.1 hypothetical protein [Okeania sp. SIO2B3]
MKNQQNSYISIVIIATILLNFIILGCQKNSQKIQELDDKNNTTLLQPNTVEEESKFQARSLAIRKKLAAVDLEELDSWWRPRNIGDPHKYLLPVILARLSLEDTQAGELYDQEKTWKILFQLDKDKPDLYHFRSYLDVRIFFLFREKMPSDVLASYKSQLQRPKVFNWIKTGTENHMFMQRASGLALMNGSGWPVGDPASEATNEAWLRAELNKFLTIGQGEFHSSVYYGYSIGGLLNIYDFAGDPELKKLAKGLLDWYATNMALRLSWGTAGGAESRGFDRRTWNSGLSALAWMWWGEGTEAAEKMTNGTARLALPAALSTYRPPEHLRALALKQVPLPFQLRASHPIYYSYSQGNRLWEKFYITEDYSLGTLLEPTRSYQVEGTISAQYVTYKLVVRDPEGINNAVVGLGGTYHGPQATGRSPGDQYVQQKGAVIFQLILSDQDLQAGVPAQSHLVLPKRYGEPTKYKNWYIWRIENIWLCARPWADEVSPEPLSRKYKDYQAMVAKGKKTAWVTDVARVADIGDFESLKQALDKTLVDDSEWDSQGRLSYLSLAGDRIVMTYQQDGAIGDAVINGEKRILQNWPVLESPYTKQELYSGLLEVDDPKLGKWQLRGKLMGPEWE